MKKGYIRKRQTQFSLLVPNDVHDTKMLDKENKNTKWKERMGKEIEGINDHDTFKFLPPGSKTTRWIPRGTTKDDILCKTRLKV